MTAAFTGAARSDVGPVFPGALLAGYRAIELLSRGQEFETYDAWSRERFSRCVVKTVRADRQSAANRARLLREGRILTTSDHPHLVRGYHLVAGPRPFVVMETLTGATLRHLIARRARPLGAGDVVMLGSQLVSALRFLHTRGHLHLDVKPENVVIDAGRVKLFDLSLAQRPGRIAARLGTPAYMSPEQVRGGRVGETADVWGLGVVLYEAATGVNPFRPDPLGQAPGTDTSAGWCRTCGVAADYRQLSYRAPSVRTVRRLPRQLAQLIDSTLEPLPTDRPSAAELHAVLHLIAGVDPPT
jgi:eukaryotic-like serine/threonine-protein kinase